MAEEMDIDDGPAAAPIEHRDLPWVDKYRPQTIDEIAYQNEIVATLRGCLSSGNFPHFLFYGPPGTGKTSSILAIAKQLWGPLYRDRVLELNASDERGIDIVRNRIKNFAKQAVQGAKTVPGYPCPPFKLIILDEADAMTHDAQAALRRTMEVHTKVTRFCILCNYVSRIIEPLASRCAKFRFRPLPRDAVVLRIRDVVAAEGIACDDATVEAIMSVSGGDMRKAITYLQSAHRLYGAALSADAVIEIAGVIPQPRIDALLAAFRANSFERTQAAVEALMTDGYSTAQLLTQLNEFVVSTGELDDLQKANLGLRLATADKALQDGAAEDLQALDLCGFAMRVFCRLPF